MNYLLSQIFLCLLATFILGFVIGWLWKNLSCKKCKDEITALRREIAELKKKSFGSKPLVKKAKTTQETISSLAGEIPKKETDIETETVKVAEVVEEKEESKDFGMPTFLSEPHNGKADDLKRIKGIGKILEATLFEKGVFHFHQIAAWTEENAKWMDTFMQFPGRIEREDWISQAKLLSKGEETDFSKKVDKNKIYD
ncbi:MAG TPA: DUF1049 domain-containing protein [Oceanospirillales bacterium]|nr:DUF1049 domain-containing protein [Oceanospirillales bacterium]